MVSDTTILFFLSAVSFILLSAWVCILNIKVSTTPSNSINDHPPHIYVFAFLMLYTQNRKRNADNIKSPARPISVSQGFNFRFRLRRHEWFYCPLLPTKRDIFSFSISSTTLWCVQFLTEPARKSDMRRVRIERCCYCYLTVLSWDGRRCVFVCIYIHDGHYMANCACRRVTGGCDN